MLSNRYSNDGKPAVPLVPEADAVRKVIRKKMSDGYFIYESVPCDCGSTNDETLSEKDRYGFYFPVVICKDCGLIRANPRWNQESYQKFYVEDYRSLYAESETPTQNFFNDQVKRGKKISSFIASSAGSFEGTVCEIGAGSGGILKAFKDEGFRTVGTDLNPKYLDYGRSLGLELYDGFSDVLIEKSISCNVVILSHVLEHFLDLEKELSTISGLLEDDGLVYVELPGVMNLYHSVFDFLKLLQNAHTYYFTLDTLNDTMARHGFSFVAGDETIRAVYRKNKPTKPTTNRYQSTKEYLEKHEKSRKFDINYYLRSGYLLYLKKRLGGRYWR
jgi:SAM-dependent methyltransferase